MRVLPVALAIALTAGACFPHNAKHRRIAKYGETAAVVGGIAMQLVANAGSCMATRVHSEDDCEDGNLDLIGLGLIAAGLIGFAATMITTPDDPPEPYRPTPPEWMYAPPEGFCAAIYRGDMHEAQAALTTFIRSTGATLIVDALASLHTWLARQPCVVVEEFFDEETPVLSITIPKTGSQHQVMVSSFPLIVEVL